MRRFDVRHVDAFEDVEDFEEAFEPFPDDAPDPLVEELPDSPLDESEDGAPVEVEEELPLLFESDESFAPHAVRAAVAASPTAPATTALRTDMRCMVCSSVHAGGRGARRGSVSVAGPLAPDDSQYSSLALSSG
ncbi:hypothetical protein ACFU99_33650 [Streptomyces sp. NPDC057654]|uniref:hypothetical protein n=1 Tax=Streptomyces sp. NPDC057654 TaxID=3346196 RepID=UPI0036C4330C